MMEPLVSYLESTVPTAACEMAVVFQSADCPGFTGRAYLFEHPLLPALIPLILSLYRYSYSKKKDYGG
jgi:hypothetical protein